MVSAGWGGRPPWMVAAGHGILSYLCLLTEGKESSDEHNMLILLNLCGGCLWLLPLVMVEVGLSCLG